MQYLFFSFWLTSLCMTDSRFIHITTMMQFHSFSWLSDIPLSICTLSSLHFSVNGHLGSFHVLAIVNSAAMNTGVHVSFGIMTFLRVHAQ